ncbi:MAG TPA: hypothetical protein VJ991_11665 [Balneolales bacterium]|nr:hypothetical protein [Balneolales bacterium]
MRFHIPYLGLLGILLSLLIIDGCSRSPVIANLSMKLHDKYETHFLHAEMKNKYDLFLIFRIDSTDVNAYKIQAKAHDIAAYAYDKVDSASKIKNVTVRFQHIGAPAVIKDPNAHVFTFSTLSLERN